MSEGRRIDRMPLGYRDPKPQRARIDAHSRARLDALAGSVVTVNVPDTANSEFAVFHPQLGKKCEEFSVVMSDGAGRLYRSSPEKWDKRVSFFRYDQAGGRISIRLR